LTAKKYKSALRQSLEVLIKLSNNGKSSGKHNTAINPALLFVFDAIAATKVRVEAIAELPRIIHKIKDKCAVMGLPKNKL
tara:strand:+ start:142 stop:381 length:240 start_codon:yes stop_codon:yes gene_type:complete